MTNYRQSMAQTLDLMHLRRESKILERELTDSELKRREEIAKDLDDQDFKDRYGQDWMQVKMATATKMAKAEEVEESKADKSLAAKAEKSGISLGILKQVFKRGVAAWRTGHRPGTTPTQWGHARVNSFITGGKTRTTGDKDLWAKAKGQKEEVDLEENYRVLARKGMGAESPKMAKYGQEVDYYEPKRGDKHSGKITKVSGTGYGITDDKTGKKFTFKFYDPKKAKQLMQSEEVELDEAVKVGDTVKVKLNRKGREYIEKGKVIKIEKDSIIVKHDFSRTPSRVSMKNIVKEEVELDEILTQRPRAGGGRHGKNVEMNLKVTDIIAKDYMKQGATKADAHKAAFKDLKAMGNAEKQDIIKKGKSSLIYMKRKQEDFDLAEDGHADVASAIRQCKTVMEDAQQIMGKLQTMNPEDSLPTWWTNKFAVASNSMNKMRDYIVNPLGEEVEIDEAKFGDKKALAKKGDKISRVQAILKGKQKPYKEEEDLDEGYEGEVVKVLKKAKIASYFSNNILYVEKGDGKDAIAALKRAPNIKELPKVREEKPRREEVDLDEGKMSQLHQLMKDGKSAKDIAKIMKLDLKTIKALMGEALDKEDEPKVKEIIKKLKGASQAHAGQAKDLEKAVKESAAADARRAMRRDPEMKQRGFSKDVSATDDDEKAASKNIMMQMRKAQSLKGRFDVEFQDGKKVKIPAKVAVAVQQKYNAMRRPAEKEKFQSKVAKSYKDMLNALKEGFASDAQRRAAFAQGYKAKGKKDKKESILDRIDNKLKERKNG